MYMYVLYILVGFNNMCLVYDTNINEADGYAELGAEPLLGKCSVERYLRACFP